MRVAVYQEVRYRCDADGYSVGRAFARFVFALRSHVDRLVLLGRVDPVPGRAPYAVPADVEFVPLPFYESGRDLPGMARAVPSTLSAIRRAVEGVDGVIAMGPQPMSLPVAVTARARGKPACLFVRQDYPEYVRHRLPGREWAPALLGAHALEGSFRLLARRLPSVVVSPPLAERYRGGGAPVLTLTISLVSEQDVGIPARAPLDGRPVELLSVGRLDPEKNPLLLLELVRRLELDTGRSFRLTVVGDGDLEETLRAGAEPFGDRVRVLGYVPNGPALLDLYRGGDLFVHTALTEGVPQVLVEAMATGLPIVATDVGGVRTQLGDGEAGLLVPPDDAAALAGAVQRLTEDSRLRTRLAATGVDLAREQTIEAQVARLASFLAEQWRRPLRDGASGP